MNIEILGSGCSKCSDLAANTQKAVDTLGIQATITKVTDLKTILGYGVMVTPALVVDGKVKSSGKLLSPEEVANFLK